MLNFNIAPAHRSANKEDFITAQTKANEASAVNVKLQVQVHHMNMLVEAMWHLLKEKTGLTDDELKKELTDVKLKYAEKAAEPNSCSNCGKAVSANSEHCVFCGTAAEKDGLFLS